MHKTEINITPFTSFNGIPFGAPREDVWKALGRPESSFHKGDEETETDIFGCFHIYYDAGYRFEAVEVVYVDEADIYYDGKQVPGTYDGVLNFFKGYFDDVGEDGAGFISLDGSVGVYKETTDQPEYDTILFAKKDYYRAVFG